MFRYFSLYHNIWFNQHTYMIVLSFNACFWKFYDLHKLYMYILCKIDNDYLFLRQEKMGYSLNSLNSLKFIPDIRFPSFTSGHLHGYIRQTAVLRIHPHLYPLHYRLLIHFLLHFPFLPRKSYCPCCQLQRLLPWQCLP